MKAKPISKEFLEEEYVRKGRGVVVIAKELGCSATCVWGYLKKHNISIRPSNRETKSDLSNKRFGKLLVKKYAGYIDHDGRWLCECDCGNKKLIKTKHLTAKSYGVKSCGCDQYTSKKRIIYIQKITKDKYKGTENLPQTKFYKIKAGAKARKIEFCISIEQADDLLIKQNFKCALTGIPISARYGEKNASLDRKNSDGDYTLDNIQWVDRRINMMKQAMTDEEFVDFCRLVCQYNDNKKTKVDIVADEEKIPKSFGNGFDLASVEEIYILPGERAVVDTGVKIKLPKNHAACILPRSGLAAKNGITVLNAPGLIDDNYRGNIKVILQNTDLQHTFHVGVGDRIAQMLIIKTEDVEWERVNELEKSERADKGIGSSGVK